MIKHSLEKFALRILPPIIVVLLAVISTAMGGRERAAGVHILLLPDQ
jgi:hypothetical protein